MEGGHYCTEQVILWLNQGSVSPNPEVDFGPVAFMCCNVIPCPPPGHGRASVCISLTTMRYNLIYTDYGRSTILQLYHSQIGGAAIHVVHDPSSTSSRSSLIFSHVALLLGYGSIAHSKQRATSPGPSLISHDRRLVRHDTT